MKCKLSDLCEYVKAKTEVSTLDDTTYISTENMIPYKGGITIVASLPNTTQTQAYSAKDTLVSNIRPYFKKIWYAQTDGGCSNDVLVFRPKKKVNSRFLYYLLSDDAFFNYATATAKGTKMPRGDKKAILEYPVPNISGESQCKIADILSGIDDKITLNQQINKNLEELAQEIFNKYFIDVPDIPDGWSEGSLTDIADYLNGLAMQKFPPMNNADSLPVLKIKELRQGMCDSDSDRCSVEIKPDYIIQDGDVIFSWSGSLLVDFWCGGDCGLNQHLFKVSSAKYDKWFYYSWTIYHLQEFVRMAADRATTMGHIKRDALEKARVLIPCHDDYVKIGNLLQPLYDLIITNRIENRRLANLRDALLPRLMSGKIDVSRIEI